MILTYRDCDLERMRKYGIPGVCIIPPWCNLTAQICGGEILWVKIKGTETRKRNNNDHLLHTRRSGKKKRKKNSWSCSLCHGML
mgnify:CR=1 FL=1